jgi:hypothetical protein
LALYANQTRYYDSSTATETRLDMYKRLAKLAEESVGIPAAEVLKNLNFQPVQIGSAEGHNVGNAVYTLVIYLILGHGRLEAFNQTWQDKQYPCYTYRAFQWHRGPFD